MSKFKVLILLFIFLFQINSFALKKLGKAGFKFLDVGIGARAAGIAGAYIVNGNSSDAVFFNPAGIAKFDGKFSFSASYTQWIADISYNAASFIYSAGVYGKFGIHFLSPSYPEIEGTAIADNSQGFIETGRYSISAFSVGLSYARSLTDKFMIGGNINYSTQDLGGQTVTYVEKDSNDQEISKTMKISNDASVISVDFGTIFYPKFTKLPTFGFAMTVRNFSPDVKVQERKFQLPLTYIIGFTADVFDIIGECKKDQRLMVEIDAIHPRDYTERLNVGFEYSYRNMFYLRTGYRFNYDEENVTFGLGYKKGPLTIDYSYGSFGVFNNVNRVSFGVRF